MAELDQLETQITIELLDGALRARMIRDSKKTKTTSL